MRDSPEKGAGMWDHGLLSAGAEKFHNKKKMFLTLANTSVKFYVFINAPFEGNIFESSLPLLHFPPTKFKHPNYQGATILACLLTLQSYLSTPPFPITPQSP